MSSASPRLSRYRTENGDSSEKTTTADPLRSSGRTGLSDYTSQRLAELRARRAAAEADYANFKTRGQDITSSAAASAPATTAASTTTSSLTSGSTDYRDSFRSRRTTDATTPTTTTSTTSSSLSYKKESTPNKTESSTYKSTSLSATSPGSSPQKKDPAATDDECVGFSSLPEQVHRKAVKRGFDFTLMVIGETGLGKSTLISSLFLNEDLYKDRKLPAAQERVDKTVKIEKKQMEIEERGVKLRLTIVDTPGFNDSVDGEESWKPIEAYINEQFDQFFRDESGINRKNIKDNRIHCCLYFVSPYGHGLRQMDVAMMKRLHDKLNIVPVIAKADTLTKTELNKLKSKVLDQVDHHRIRIYSFPDCDSDEDEEFKKQDADLKLSVPFAVIGSNAVVDVNGRKVRGRLYPWGIVEVDNPDHCDFLKLRQMLISTHMQDLKDVTRDIHYENYRAKYIKEQMSKQQRERSKLKRDSSPNFESIMDSDKLLQQKDDEIRRMQDMLQKMAAQLEATGRSPKHNGHINGLGNL